MKSSYSHIGVLVVLFSCSYPFALESIDDNKVLIVNGIITGDLGNQQIELSLAASLDTLFIIPSSDAEVIVTKNFTETYVFQETTPGIYKSIDPFKGEVGDQFELTINYPSGESYKSEVVTHKPTVPIDSIAAVYSTNNDIGGVEVRVISTRTNEAVKYLRWTYDETYEIKVPFASLFRWVGGNKAVTRDTTERVETCWRTIKGENVFIRDLNTTAVDGQLGLPIRFIENDAVELRHKVSFLVTQYTVDFTGYSFWNTFDRILSENGSLADVQPGNPVGNIYSEEGHAVIGYFDASDIAQKRVFIKPSDFEGQFTTSKFDWDRCIQRKVRIDTLGKWMTEVGEEYYTLYRELDKPGNPPSVWGYTYVLKSCGDCRVYGTNSKPEFWQ